MGMTTPRSVCYLKLSLRLIRTFGLRIYLLTLLSFCEDAKIVTENGTTLMDLEKFDAAIKKFEEVQKAVAKFQKTPLRT